MRSWSSSARMPCRLPNPLKVPLRGCGEAQIVEQRGMKQVRQIAHRMKHSVGD